MVSRWKALAERLERETYALYLAYRDPRTPWYAKVFAALVVAHTVSPIDLIPDFIPILGYLDDIIITPLGIWLSFKMIPREVILNARSRASEAAVDGKINTRLGLAVVLAIWVIGAVILMLVLYKVWVK